MPVVEVALINETTKAYLFGMLGVSHEWETKKLPGMPHDSPLT